MTFQILPTSVPWIPNLVGMITDVTLNGKKGILIDKKLIEGPNANDRGKIFIPLILAFQVSLFYIVCASPPFLLFYTPSIPNYLSDFIFFILTNQFSLIRI